jgi:DNA-directed RNA polymerase subunit RPC12/RpoP
MKHAYAYKMDLTKIKGKGDFACPGCGTRISPDDQSEAAYSILGSKVDNTCLEEVVIRCNKCSSHIHLTGFSLLQELDMSKARCEVSKRRIQTRYISHI